MVDRDFRTRVVGNGKRDGRNDRGEQIVAGHHPLIRLLLDADKMVVSEPMRAGMVLGLDGVSPVPDHQVQDRNGAIQRRKPGDERECQQAAPVSIIPTHR